MTLPGIDVSNHNGLVVWPRVGGAGITFAGLKASEGTGFSDSFFPANLTGARAAGIVPLPYHFARPDLNDPEPEAGHFANCLTAAGGLRPGEPVFLDMEIAASATGLRVFLNNAVEAQPTVRKLARAQQFAPMLGPTWELSGHSVAATKAHRMRPIGTLLPMTTLEWVNRWIAEAMRLLGFRPMFYSGLWFMTPHGLIGDATLSQSGLALAAYQATAPAPPPLWEVLAIWQNSDTGTVPGIVGPVDTDVFNGTLDLLHLYGGPVAPPKRQMTNDDYTEGNRILLADGRLNPVEAAAFFSQFDD